MRPQFVTTMILQSLVDPRRMLMDLRQKFHVQGFMGTFVVEDLDKIVEAGLLLKEVCGSGLGGFFLQSEMHALVTAVLLRMARPTRKTHATRPVSRIRSASPCGKTPIRMFRS